MFKVNYKDFNFAAATFFTIFKCEKQANDFIAKLGDRFVSMKVI